MSTREVAAFRIERSFAASPEDVFDAWTSPEVLKRWWGARPTWTSPGCDVDLRVGGRYTLRMLDDSGEAHIVGGEYREIERPRRLVYTWCWERGGGPPPGHVSLVTVEFRGDGERTTVVLEHSGLSSEESRQNHGWGWNGALEKLAERIFPSAQQQKLIKHDNGG
jgi:uncharacterized protein YndB with AHSA1/START domain